MSAAPVSAGVIKRHSRIHQSLNDRERDRDRARKRKGESVTKLRILSVRETILLYPNSSLHDAFVQSSRQFARTREHATGNWGIAKGGERGNGSRGFEEGRRGRRRDILLRTQCILAVSRLPTRSPKCVFPLAYILSFKPSVNSSGKNIARRRSRPTRSRAPSTSESCGEPLGTRSSNHFDCLPYNNGT